MSEGPEDRRSQSSTPSGQGAPYLSPRLREKLGGGGGGSEGGGGGGDKYDDFKIPEHSYGGWIFLGVVLIAIGAGVFWMVHNNQLRKAAEAKAARAAREAAVRDSMAMAARADSIAAKARADSLAFAALPKWKQKQILAQRAKAHADSLAAANKAANPKPAGGAAAGGAAAAGAAAANTPAKPDSNAPPPAPKEKGPYAVDVGDYIDEGRANEVADALKPTAGAAVQVIPVTGDGGTTYHVFVGNFKSRASAEALGAKLFGKGIVEQANVTPLPKAPEAAKPAESPTPPTSP